MSSILRQIVAGPRLQHPEAGLDLCYVTNNVIATSGPSATYPQRAYRNPLDALVSFLDSKHGTNWCIWEFRAEGTGYPDSEVYGRIHHFPWPDHHPPPFALIPNIMASMRNWLQREGKKTTDPADQGERMVVVHCKAGKGRSGTVACAYLISQEGWKKVDALQRFTERRMRVGFGTGVSIPSQLRYVDYIDLWANQMRKEYVERPVEILEVHIWGLRDGVKVAVEGFVDEGKKIECFYRFHRHERIVVESGNTTPSEPTTPIDNNRRAKRPESSLPSSTTWSPAGSQSDVSTAPESDLSRRATLSPTHRLSASIFRPSKPVVVPGSDVNIDFERRSKASYTGFAMVTSVAHVWFNAYFEGGSEHNSGVFETEWDAMDGIKGSTKKGIRALDRLKVVWRYPPPSNKEAEAKVKAAEGRPISQPKPGDPVPESRPADWRGPPQQQEPTIPHTTTDPAPGQETQPPTQAAQNEPALAGTSHLDGKAPSAAAHLAERELGLRKQTDESKDVSLVGSEDETQTDGEGCARKIGAEQQHGNGDIEGVRSYFAKNGNGDKEKEHTSSADRQNPKSHI
ncbi:hypothetical protein NUU61_010193 [Penicillium alfredii]|uniref:phosphatidylinositol-3,4,5-trisphosphate 3-phosphatase n=1 Tax=Penicillium alfredii TaxID=1506179 RepID=A0A9W9JTZ9_9EURO|nr:uncharacterized protein NUU61_010193 [Penicillium alfredii]KAJ5081929.1 hypothetical protein NUU61_010193 [Penicillium alfredii]